VHFTLYWPDFIASEVVNFGESYNTLV